MKLDDVIEAIEALSAQELLDLLSWLKTWQSTDEGPGERESGRIGVVTGQTGDHLVEARPLAIKLDDAERIRHYFDVPPSTLRRWNEEG